MRILFVNGQAFMPQIVGGLEISTVDLCFVLKSLGHEPAVMCRLGEGDLLWAWNRVKSRLLGKLFPMSKKYGLRIYRGWDLIKGLPEVIEQEKPDAVVVQGGLFNAYEIAAESLRRGYNTFYYTHDLSVIVSGVQLPDLQGLKWIANSQFTAHALQQYLNVESAIVPPLIRPELYGTETSRTAVTMINPRPEKGGELAVRIAELCPDIPFVFVEAWSNKTPAVLALKARAALLKNVSWLPVHKQMGTIYGMTRILLMPSQVKETWGRVVTEAQLLGIPALVSQLGALPETVGSGGIAVAHDAAPEIWAEELRKLWQDDGLYEQYSQAARNFSAREEILPKPVALKFIAALEK